MKFRKKHKISSLLFCMILCPVLLFGALPLSSASVQAATGRTGDIANLVIFAKMQGDTQDFYNAVYNSGTWVNDNCENLLKMFDGGNLAVPSAGDNSFSNYIHTITEGKITVHNVFPQVYTASDGTSNIDTFTLSQSRYDSDMQIVSEIIAALNNGTIALDSSVRLDYQTEGILDNLVIIIQGNQINGNTHAYSSQYGGTDSFNGLKVYSFNAIPSSMLITEDASIHVGPEQGVLAHEFLHTLGLPDLYRYSGSGEPVGIWDIMAANDSRLQYPLSYLRYREGWLEGSYITEPGEYTLTAVSKSGGNKLFLIKTPLPEADSETICLEFRIKGNQYQEPFEGCLPDEDGLIMYRINDSVENLTNSLGQNYIYVYRPDVTTQEDGTDTDSNGINLSRKAALHAANGETSYGSTDLSAAYTENTLYYSDGQNSGIQISGLTLSEDGNSVTFHVSFADYTQYENWETCGGNVSQNVSGDPDFYIDPATGNLYLAYLEGENSTYRISVKTWNTTSQDWEQVGTTISDTSNAGFPRITVCQGEVFLAGQNASGSLIFYQLTGDTWNPIAVPGVDYANSVQLISDGSNLYAAWEQTEGTNTVRLVLYDVKNARILDNTMTTGYSFCNPKICKQGNLLYMLWSAFSGGQTALSSFDLSTGVWSTVHLYQNITLANTFDIQQSDGKLYMFLGASGKSPLVSVYDGALCTEQQVSDITSYYGGSLEVISNQIYVTYQDNTTGKTEMLCREESGFSVCFENLGNHLQYLNTCSYGDTIYIATKPQGVNSVVVRSKTLSGAASTPTPTPTPTPTVPVLRLTPPVGYTDSHIYIDGVPYEAAAENGTFALTLPNTEGKTAVMYRYNSNQVPVGMYVWKLTYNNNVCTAIPLPGLEDLISYHGFSIRVQAPAGIRFKSGIDTETKRRLIEGNVDGYHLTEYGTLFITEANMQHYPFVKGGTKVGGGRSYWTENGVVNDKVFETVGGRNRFASVLINLSPGQYATNIAFRGYIILEDASDTIIVYGPPVSRSIYTVAKQILNKGEFAPGTNGYNYVSNIVNTVEGK